MLIKFFSGALVLALVLGVSNLRAESRGESLPVVPVEFSGTPTLAVELAVLREGATWASAAQSDSQTPRQLARAIYNAYLSQGYSEWDACGELLDFMNNEAAAVTSFYICPGPHVTEAMATANYIYLDDLGEAVESLIESKCGYFPDLDAFYDALDSDC